MGNPLTKFNGNIKHDINHEETNKTINILSPVPLIGVATTTFLVFTTIVETMYIANLRLNLLDQVRDAVDAGAVVPEIRLEGQLELGQADLGVSR